MVPLWLWVLARSGMVRRWQSNTEEIILWSAVQSMALHENPWQRGTSSQDVLSRHTAVALLGTFILSVPLPHRGLQTLLMSEIHSQTETTGHTLSSTWRFLNTRCTFVFVNLERKELNFFFFKWDLGLQAYQYMTGSWFTSVFLAETGLGL